MELFTINNDMWIQGVKVEPFMFFGGEQPVISVGEKGVNRRKGIMRVRLSEASDNWRQKEFLLKYAKISNNYGNLELSEEKNDSDEGIIFPEIICVIRTHVIHLGVSSPTGDCIGKDNEGNNLYAPFPGIYLCTGVIAKGEAGYDGTADQIIAIIPPNFVFRTGNYYYKWDGKQLLGGLTIKQRQISGKF